MTWTNRSPRFFPIFLQRSSDAVGSQYLDSFTGSNLPLERLISSSLMLISAGWTVYSPQSLF
jgi:hypothetical protein